MPITLPRHDLFPDDNNALPAAGSSEQKLLLEDEHEIGNADYLKSLEKLSDVTDSIYPELISNCVNVLRAVAPTKKLRVMDLCSGVGLVSMKLLEQDLEIEELTLVDLSPLLLERAIALLQNSPNFHKIRKITTVQADLLVDDFERFAADSFDLVVTCNAFQHFPRERQRQLFAHIQRVLGPNGVFIFSSHFKLMRPNWKEFVIEDMLSSLRKHGAPDATVENARHHVAHYHNYLNVADVYNWLEAAGFGFFDCTFRRFIIGIFAAVK
ncbi:MAG TPA: class I SAM-dependent methyltransferase [Polyangia bacterium]|nr:class I SAM-dependent methyltransferase [Polyangia bacterium]